MLLLTLFACASTDMPERLLVVDRVDDGYSAVPRALPELTDARHMEGELGRGFRGGFFRIGLLSSDLSITYVEGGDIDVHYVIDADGVGVPLDEDGLVLWTYYHTMSSVRAELTDKGYDVSPIFPINFAYQPVFAVQDFTSGENAAYVGGGVHMFMLLPDMLDSVIPLAANPGVIRHEFGHSFFQLLTVGDVRAAAPYDAVDAPEGSSRARALNEGFADMMATLTLDDPAFMEMSLPDMEGRDVRGDAVASPGLYDSSDSLSFDPYALGTVYASFAWDLRELHTPDEALGWAIEGVEGWADEANWPDTDRWAEIALESSVRDRPSTADEACAAYATRFPDNETPQVCQ